MSKETHIAYLCHIPWDWIKQRPQFIAEELAKKYSLTYYQAKMYKTHNLKKNDRSSVKIEELKRIPTLGDRLSGIVAIND